MSEKTFRCPKCGGSYFTTWHKPKPNENEVEARSCGDEYGRGCHWHGPDSECMFPVCSHCEGTGIEPAVSNQS